MWCLQADVRALPPWLQGHGTHHLWLMTLCPQGGLVTSGDGQKDKEGIRASARLPLQTVGQIDLSEQKGT